MLAMFLVVVLIGVSMLSTAGLSQGRQVKLVVLGDSLSAGYMLPANAAFPAVLERALKAAGHNVVVANAGVSGDTATAGQQRLDWSVPDGTDGVIVELGANDMLRGIDPKVTRAALEDIVKRLQARRIPVLLAGMRAAPNLGPDYVDAFESIYRDLAATHGVPLYPFFLEGIAGERGLNLQDGLHPTAEGVEAIVRRILPAVEAFVKAMPAD